MPAVNFVNEHKSIDVLPGGNLRKAALKSGIQLYKPVQRVFHLNLQLGPVSIPCTSDVVEIEGKGVNPRTADEERLISGRLVKRKVTPNMRLACLVEVKGDISVKTLPTIEIDKVETKRAFGYIAVVTLFLALMAGMFGIMALDLVNRL